MALQVWLPFDGNLNNQGINNVTITNNGAAINNSGKIGKCYSFGTSASYMTIPKEAMTSLTTEASVCFWIKVISWNTSYATFLQAGLSSTPWTHYTFGFLRNNAASTCCFTISNGSTSSQAQFLTPTLELNTWYHISLLYKTGHCLIYINGELYRDYTTSIVPNFAGITHITLGACNTKTNYQTNCLLNDFRIYSHCLSPKEVKDISKGLVLHYPLNNGGFGNVNLLSPSLLSSSAPWTAAVVGSEVYKGRNAVLVRSNSIYNNTSSGTLPAFPSLTFKANTPYTLSVTWCDHLRTDSYSSSLYFRFRYTDGTSSSNIISPPANNNADWVHVSVTSDPTKVISGITSTYGRAGTVSIADIKLEEGSEDTGVSLTTDDDSPSVIYDCSGYKNDGNINGTLGISTDVSRYIYSTSFSGTSYVYRTPLDSSSEIKTISFWANWDTFAGGASNQSVLFVDNGTKTGFGLMSTGILLSTSAAGKSNTYSKSSLVVNKWYHFVILVTGPTARDLYINGVKQTPTSNTSEWTYSVNQLQIGKRSTTSDGFKGKMCDFRMYSTTLSEDEIKELYNTSAFVLNNGCIEGYEFIEDGANPIVTKSGLVKSTLFEENNSVATFGKNSSTSTMFIEI